MQNKAAPEKEISNFEPLVLNGDASKLIQCPLCDDDFEQREPLLTHMAKTHQLIFAEPDGVACWQAYMRYWKSRFLQHPISHYAYEIQESTRVNEAACPKQTYYFINVEAPDDLQIRNALRSQRLAYLLRMKEEERNDTAYVRKCLFCEVVCKGSRKDLFTHMLKAHAFNIGLVDNIIYADEFLDILEAKLVSNHCIYCEKDFRDKKTLKEHMRKKWHHKIKATNAAYDRFYLVNYIETFKVSPKNSGCPAVQAKEEDEPPLSKLEPSDPHKDEDEWEDWIAHLHDLERMLCVVCPFETHDIEALLAHMLDIHGFDLKKLAKDHLKLEFYDYLKLVNYLRKAYLDRVCPVCKKWCSIEEFADHATNRDHTSQLFARLSVHPSEWKNPLNMIPIMEHDPLLCCYDAIVDYKEEDNSLPT